MSFMLNRTYHEIRCQRMDYNLHTKKPDVIYHLQTKKTLPSKNHGEAEHLVPTIKHSLQKDQGRKVS